jgi:DNA gyrase subunit A
MIKSTKKRSIDPAELTFADQKIVPVNMESEVKRSFLEYSMSVIVSRALPDVRDGLKPGARRIIYAMYEDNLTASNAFHKSAATVGNVLGRYHPHGDAAVYGTMVRMAQDFSLRYPLIEGEGNFGSVDGDPPAAYRYTEARLARISEEMVRDIEKNTVDMVPNFDNRRKEPEVLPSRFPNLLVNGSIGIAVGMATNIPTHNLSEVIDGTVCLIDDPDASLSDVMEYIKGPDFPTHGIIYGKNGILQAYKTGRGHVMVRSRAEIDEEEHHILVTEIPYMVNKSLLIEAMAQKVRDKTIDGITDIRDESDMSGMRIVIECRRDANLQVVLNQLYKYTQLQDTCAINMLALVDGEPKVLPLISILKEYIKFQREVIVRRTQFDLDKNLREAHIYEGYKIAIDNIDEVVQIIRQSPDVGTAKENLIARFGLSEEQAQAIVQMTLGRLTGMERDKIEAHLAELHEKIDELRAILADESKIMGIVREELLEIKRKYGDERRTELVDAEEEIDIEDLIERHQCVITLSHAGYIKRQPADTYSAQRRGGKGMIGAGTKEEDFIENVIVSDSHSLVMMFTSRGKVHVRKAWQIPEASRTAKGTNIVNVLELESGEKLTAIIPVAGFDDERYLVMATLHGVIKRTALTEFEYQRRGGKIAINLDEGDELIFVAITDGTSDIFIATHEGIGARFAESAVRDMGRTARGVRAIRLREDDFVIGAVIIEDSELWRETHRIVSVTEGGFGKRVDPSEYGVKGRGIKGMLCHKLSDKTGKLNSVSAATEDDDIMLITNQGTIIRTPVKDIPVYSRTAAGVIVMRLNEGAMIVNTAIVSPFEGDGDEGSENAEE